MSLPFFTFNERRSEPGCLIAPLIQFFAIAKLYHLCKLASGVGVGCGVVKAFGAGPPAGGVEAMAGGAAVDVCN